MIKLFFRFLIKYILLSCIVFFDISSLISPDGLSNAIGHFDMTQRMSFTFDNWIGNELRKDSTILAIRELRVSQGYGDPLYKKFYDLSIVRFYGALNLSFSMRTRQDVIASTMGTFLFPARYLPDEICCDINAHGKTVVKAQLSRFGVFFNPFTGMTETDIYGILEFDFSGISANIAYLAKLRHAFGEIVWNSGAFLFGQYFHPLFLKECFPRTIDFNLGAPYEAQGLTPQIRLSQRIGPIECIIALGSESYLLSFAPILELVQPSIIFIREGIIPDITLQAKFIQNNSFYGGAINYKRLTPRRAALNGMVKVNEYIDSLIGELFIHNVFNWGELNMKVIYSQNGSDQLLMSGFAVETTDINTDFRTYTNTSAISTWLDIFWVFYYQEVSVGLFVGYAKNLGANNPLYIDPTTRQPIVYAINGLAQNVSYTARISPRVVFARDAFRFGFECSWNGVSYGCLNEFAKVINATPVASFSYTISLDYVF